MQPKNHTIILFETSKYEAALPLPLTLQTFAESFNKNLLPCFSFVCYYLRGNSAIDMFFTRKGLGAGIFFSTDEALSHLSGYINSQNSSVWSAENPHSLHENPLHSSKIGIWCALSRKQSVRPLFFQEIITAENYISRAEFYLKIP
jgi:hypothetical protein